MRTFWSGDELPAYGDYALKFAICLAERRFGDARAMLSSVLQDDFSSDDLRASFEEMVTEEVGPFYAGNPVMTIDEGWPDKGGNDVGWAYIPIYCDDFGEAVTVIVCEEGQDMKIREIEWGRP